MKVRMKTLMCGPNGTYHPGGVVELPDETAQMLIAEGYADLVETTSKADLIIETTTIEPTEKAVLPKSKRRKR